MKELLTTSNLNNGTLTLNFSDNLTAIEAGKPYIVKWAKADGYDEADPETRDVKNPVFTGVTVSSTTPTAVEFTGGSFVGQYSPFSIDNSNINSVIMLGSGNSNRGARCYNSPYRGKLFKLSQIKHIQFTYN